MYFVRKIQVSKSDVLFGYCDAVSRAANSLYNATLFRVRQVLTATEKDECEWMPNEREIMEEIRSALPTMGDKFSMPTKEKNFLSYGFLDALMKVSKNPDYFCADLPRQSAQHVIKEVVGAMKAFYAARRAYEKHPDKFKAEPCLPGYRRKGGLHTVTLTNQDCILREIDGITVAKLPKTHERCFLGPMDGNMRLKQATITPFHGVFVIAFVMESEDQHTSTTEQPKRVCAIDFGINNLAAVTNNVGLQCLLFKGGAVKCTNQWYNKRMAEIVSAQTSKSGKKFRPTPESDKLCVRRRNVLLDTMHKVGKSIVRWCVENRIDTIVMGHNNDWKQRVNIGHVNNQTFVQIPFGALMGIIQYLAEREGIRIILQEESYTSAASFPDMDAIPVYGTPEADNAKFSGRRGPGGHRGLYKTSNGTLINADLNAAANIGRKAFPELFSNPACVAFDNVAVIKHPDLESMQANRKIQKTRATAAKAVEAA